MKKIITGLMCLSLCACAGAADHRRAVSDDSGDRVTVGTVQREIKVGMSSAEVASVLGSPNMVTTDENRCENWVYDKIATERVVSTSNGGLGIGGAGPVATGGLFGILTGSSSSGASSTSQRTMTIIIKFDKDAKVRDYSYRSSSF